MAADPQPADTGSGGVFGQGYLNGTQTQSGYGTSLPARWTDFIFSVAGEELGMIGCVAILLLLTAIIVRVLLVAKMPKPRSTAMFVWEWHPCCCSRP